MDKIGVIRLSESSFRLSKYVKSYSSGYSVYSMCLDKDLVASKMPEYFGDKMTELEEWWVNSAKNIKSDDKVKSNKDNDD